MRRNLVLAGLMLFVLVGKVLATAADQYRLAGVMAFDRIIAAAVVDNRLYVLGQGTLTAYDLEAPGNGFRAVETLAVGEEFVELEAAPEGIVLCSRLGAIEIYVRDNDRLRLAAQTQAPDSILAVTLFQGRLCVAHGYSGVSCYSVTDPAHPVLKSRLTEPDYAGDLRLSAECLYVLDRLNGVQVYDFRSALPKYLAEIPTDAPVLDLAADRDGVAICDGSPVVSYWHFGSQTGVEFDHSHNFEFPVTSLAANPLRSFRMLAGSERGDLALYDPAAQVVVAHTRMSSPVSEVLAAQEATSFPYVALLQSSGLAAFAAGDMLDRSKQLRVGDVFAAVLAVSDGLIASTERGLVLLHSQDGSLRSRMLVPGAPLMTTLASYDDLLLGASFADGRIQVYRRDKSDYEQVAEIWAGVVVIEMSIRKTLDGMTALYAFSRDRTLVFQLFADGSAELIVESEAQVPTSHVAVSEGRLVSVSENGDVSLKIWDRLHLPMIIVGGVNERPRDLQLVGDSILAVVSASGLDIYRPDFEFARLEHLHSTPGIYAPYAIDYDIASGELLIADGYAGLKYLDSHNTLNPGPVYTIEETEGATTVTHFGNTFYCLSSGWLKVFERVATPESHYANRADFATLEAFPNPFNSTSEIALTLNESTPLPVVVNLSLLNILGQTLAEANFVVAVRELRINWTELVEGNVDCPSGIYFLRANAGGKPVTRKLVLLK